MSFGGSAIIINSLIYEEMMKFTSDAIQSASVKIRCNYEDVVIAAVYCRPRCSFKENDFKKLFNSFGNKCIAGGDYNSKHTHWGSRLCKRMRNVKVNK